MELGPIEKFFRYIVVLALGAVVVFAGLAVCGVIRMPGHDEAEAPQPPAQTTTTPRPRPVATETPVPPIPAVILDEPPGKGTFNSDSLAAPTSGAPAPAASP